MDRLRSRVTTAIVAAFISLIGIDVLDDLFLGNRWAGCPKELYPLIGAILAGLFAAQAFRRNGNVNSDGNGQAKEGG